MKINFCDICNESVPQSQLDKGQALVRKGRVICAVCEGAMHSDPAGETQSDRASDTKISGSERTLMPDAGATQVEARSMAPAAYPKDSSGGLVAGFLAAVSVVLVAVVAVMLIDRIEELDGSIEDKLSDFRRDLGNTEGRLVERFNDAQAAYLVSSSGLSSDIGSLKEARLEDNRLLRERLDETVRGVENLRERMGAMALTEREVADHARSIAGINAALSAIDLDLGQLAKDLADRPSVVIAAPVPEDTGPTWLSLLNDLESENSGVRWNAVEDLGHTSDVGVVPHLIPVLQDEDTFVRMAAARVLGGLGSDASIGPLIDALADPAPSVRDAAVSSLRLLTSQNFRFDPLGKETERAKRLRAWRDWHADYLEKQKPAEGDGMTG
ncbi:MAG: hypothetical protein ACI9C2_002352 [Gammaproteobacteria bacterium]|jgi:hypothetical protein